MSQPCNTQHSLGHRRKRHALLGLSCGAFLIGLDTAIVNVALPDLVVNAYLLGIALFTLASLVCGVARTQAVLVAGRAAQGFGGAFVWATGLSQTFTLFPEPQERVNALSVFGLMSTGGGCLSLLVGGALTSTLDWHWIFLINCPIGVLVYALGARFFSATAESATEWVSGCRRRNHPDWLVDGKLESLHLSFLSD